MTIAGRSINMDNLFNENVGHGPDVSVRIVFLSTVMFPWSYRPLSEL